jgi:predicted acylesterase/phospholipase RssA
MADDEREYCDIVMKGGITSGLVYPNAVLALCRKYRFKNIGGTSAGAIAAAAVAAAALGERRKQQVNGRIASGMGFDGLRTVAGKLKTQGFVYSLFQPARGAEAVYRLILALTRKPGLFAGGRAVVRAVLSIAPVTAITVAGVLSGGALLIGGWRGLLAASLPALFCTLVVAAARALFGAASLLRANRLGLCSGLAVKRGRGQSAPGLTEWLHTILQSLAGQGDKPLTFSDLWEAPEYPDEPKHLGPPETEKVLQLAMITTGISHHEPRTLPFEGSRFWYREDEFRCLFPKDLVDSISDKNPIEIDGKLFHRFPNGGALPVLIATRMSLSFPLLISAVPLYEPDYRAMKAAQSPKQFDQDDGKEEPAAASRDAPSAMRVCWFSDGGIGSNFPIHLFDAALPRWPTFAIDLTYPKADSAWPDAIFLPEANREGWQRSYFPFEGKNALGEIAGFVFAIIATMQNWRDLLQSRAPGHRDRIVHIALSGNEGGMNLDMPQDVLDSIAEKGGLAGEKLVDRFKFDNHWWMRWRNVAATTERFLGEFAIGAGPPISASYGKAQQSASTGYPDPPSYAFEAGQRDEAKRRFRLLKRAGEKWAGHQPGLTKNAPKPTPRLRITPTF